MFPGQAVTAFIRSRYPRQSAMVLATALLAALCQTAALFAIASGAVAARLEDIGLGHLLGVLAWIAVAALAKALSLGLAVRIGEQAALSVSLGLAETVSRTETLTLAATGRATILARLDADVGAVATAAAAAVPALQSVCLIGASALYLLIAAPEPTLLLGLVTVMVFLLFPALSQDFERSLDTASTAEDRFAAAGADFLDGTKELRLAEEKGQDFLAAALWPALRGVRRLRRVSAGHLVRTFLLVDLYIYGSLGLIAFAFPVFGLTTGLVLAAICLAYLVDRFDFLALDIPVLVQGDQALARITALDRRLATEPAPRAQEPPAGFARLELRGLAFAWPAPQGGLDFQVGPFDLAFPRPGISFITGGNGSGKSTLLHLLTGLYPPSGGAVLADGQPVPRGSLRALFAAVFTDYHLFDRLYGLDVDPEAVDRLLRRLGLDSVTGLEGDRFTTVTALSTGQRKRLALVAALLEDRPAYVFDEWTADQDPAFRRLFYTELLPELKAAGKLVIAVTHDDRWFGCCDQLIRLERGRLLTAGAPGGLPS